MSKLRKFWDNFEGYCCVVSLAAMSIIVIMQVVFRFILRASLPWSEEVSRYLLVWTTFMGGAYAVRQGAHLGIEAFMLLLPKNIRKIVGIFVMACCAVLCVIIVRFSLDLSLLLLRRNQLSPALRIPIGYMYMALPVGMTLFAVRYIQNIVLAIKGFHKKDEAVEPPAELDQGSAS